MPVVDNNGTDIHYEVAGSGPPLILQHGRLGSGRFWQEHGYVAALEGSRTLIMIDARGHGQSAKPHDPDAYHPNDVASDVVAVMDDLGIAKTDFFGYSMGGRIGFITAAYFGDRLNALIAGGAGPYGPALSREAELRLAETLDAGLEAYLTSMDRMLERVTPEPDRTRLLSNDSRALAALARATADWPDVANQVAASGVAIQLFGGSADPIWPLIKKANDQLPGSELRCFDGLGHGEDLRRPDLVIPVVADFLDRAGLDA